MFMVLDCAIGRISKFLKSPAGSTLSLVTLLTLHFATLILRLANVDGNAYLNSMGRRRLSRSMTLRSSHHAELVFDFALLIHNFTEREYCVVYMSYIMLLFALKYCQFSTERLVLFMVEGSTWLLPFVADAEQHEYE